MRIEISTNAADLITELALDEMQAIESGETSYGDTEANIAAIEALAEVIDAIESEHPRTVVVR